MKATFVSDLHLGDGGPADDFTADVALIRFLTDHQDDLIVIVGDLVDMWQVRNLVAVYKAHFWLCVAITRYVDYIVIGNHDGNLKRFCGHNLIEALVIDGIMAMHGQQFDRWNSGPLRWIGKAATGLAGWLERVIHRDADKWLARQGRKIAGHGRYGDRERYAKKALEYLKKHPELRGMVLGHTHQRDVRYLFSPWRFRREDYSVGLWNAGHWTGKDAGKRCDYVEIEVADGCKIEVLTEV